MCVYMCRVCMARVRVEIIIRCVSEKKGQRVGGGEGREESESEREREETGGREANAL